jgi:GcrA cell cycle regulator
MHGKSDPWTDEETALLRELATADHSATQIAMRIPGKSRNSVIGKLHRLGLSTSGQAYIFWNAARDAELMRLTDEGYSQPMAAEQIGCTRMAARDRLARLRREGKGAPNLSTRYRPQKAAGRLSVLTGLPLASISKPLPAPKRVARDAAPRKLKFLELHHGHCRYILDEGDGPANMDSVYCGADTVEGGSWCGPHRRMVFQPR